MGSRKDEHLICGFIWIKICLVTQLVVRICVSLVHVVILLELVAKYVIVAIKTDYKAGRMERHSSFFWTAWVCT